MLNGKLLNYANLNKINYESNSSKRKRSMSRVIISDRFTTNNIYPHYPNYINPINCINNQNVQYPNYFTNYNTSNNYHINASQQNIFFGKENQKYYNGYNAPNNYYMDNISKSVNRKLINEAKEKLRSVSNENNLKQKKKNNFERLDIINCETQYPIMTCLNADPYNRLKRKSFIQNFNNINNYIINSNTKNSNETNENSEHKMSSIQSESLFNNRYLKSKSKYNGFNNSCYNFRIKDKSNNKTINNSLTKNDIIYENDIEYTNNNLKKSKLKESIIKLDYEDKLSKINKITNFNNKTKENKSIYGDKQEFVIKIKKFIGYIEQYFISSFQKLYHEFLSQMLVYIKERIYENKNLLLKRFQRARNNRITDNSFKDYSPDNSQKLDGSYNDINKIYVPKKQQLKYIKSMKKQIHNINIINKNNNSNSNTITYLKTDYNLKTNSKPFKKRIIDKDNNSVDKLRHNPSLFNNENRSQNNLFSLNNYSPTIPVYSKNKYILKTNIKNNNKNQNKNKIIYTKKRTNKFIINKKFITEELLKDNKNQLNNMKNYKSNPLSFINIHGKKSPINMKYKVNERYNKEYIDDNDEENENEDTIEQTIIKDICTYDKKFSVFIKYVTSQRYEQSYLRLKSLKYKNLYLNHKLNYIGGTHTDSITLKSCYSNLKIMMNEISEEKESLYLSNIQDDETALNKLISMINVLELYQKKNILYLYQKFFDSLKYITKLISKKQLRGRNDREDEDMTNSKTYFKFKNKDILLDNEINYKKKFVNLDLLNDIFKRSNSVKASDKEFKINNKLDLKEEIEKSEELEKKLFLLKINLIKFSLSKNNLKEENYSNLGNEQNDIINTD